MRLISFRTAPVNITGMIAINQLKITQNTSCAGDLMNNLPINLFSPRELILPSKILNLSSQFKINSDEKKSALPVAPDFPFYTHGK
jgi:hypothetical protein